MPHTTARPDGRDPFVFVVGCPRSGTTLLQRMLDHHPDLAVANDTHFIPRAVKGLDIGPDTPLTPELVERVRTYRRFYRLGLDEAEVDEAARDAATYRAFVGRLYTIFARKQGKPLGGEKTPDYARSIAFLHDVFPDTRFVHIIRDGRDVTLSTLDWAKVDKGPSRWTLWPESRVGTCALWWKWQVEQGRRDGRALGAERYHEVSYEVLSAEPEAELGAVVRFLGLPDAPEMARFYEGKTRSETGLSAKKAWLPATPGLRDWRTQMDEADVALFEVLAGDLLDDLGYSRSGIPPSPAVEAEAARCLRWWTENGQRPKHRSKRELQRS